MLGIRVHPLNFLLTLESIPFGLRQFVCSAFKGKFKELQYMHLSIQEFQQILINSVKMHTNTITVNQHQCVAINLIHVAGEEYATRN